MAPYDVNRARYRQDLKVICIAAIVTFSLIAIAAWRDGVTQHEKFCQQYPKDVTCK